ncbi:hypothetical protein [Erythrobacter aureus]|uniref:DUF551 domain-containing protein n=1 Tax=Erythrobacter aureus TaxID=2182384 RepID=A0A345YJG3_9SPHN|nr:hypothetical protein [Erythrobacter aureus]AXK44065.1 hypothetical protein DVR09_16565 [Erythrobacter aureus]
MTKWKPIEDAPKDGSWQIVGCWVTHEDGSCDWSFWAEPLDGGPIGCDGRYGDPATHYLPQGVLPDPPAYEAPECQN